jgi:hypothetical protein
MVNHLKTGGQAPQNPVFTTILHSLIPTGHRKSDLRSDVNRDYSFLVAAFMAIWRHARNSGAELGRQN